jgi:hypothetical protein
MIKDPGKSLYIYNLNNIYTMERGKLAHMAMFSSVHTFYLITTSSYVHGKLVKENYWQVTLLGRDYSDCIYIVNYNSFLNLL